MIGTHLVGAGPPRLSTGVNIDWSCYTRCINVTFTRMSISFIVKTTGGYKAVKNAGHRRFVAFGATSAEARKNLKRLVG